MRRYASIDFLRGLAIWLMIFMHTLMRWYDRSWLEQGDTAGAPVILMVIFIVIVFFGGSAGFFLMVSATANMISMQRSLEKGRAVKQIVTMQVVGGILLLMFAMLCEAIIGYHGTLGELALGNVENWTVMLWRGFHMETIHTIAFCIIINGIVQALLSRDGGFQKTKRNVRIYAILAIICIVITLPIWELLKFIIPGYPMAINPETGEMVQYPYIGKSGFGEFILLFIFMPLGGHPEPIFPFLAISFIGSIIGIYLTQEKPPMDFPKKGMYIGFVMFLVGGIGTALVIILEIESIGTFLGNFWNVPGLYPNSWFWWFLCTNGGALVQVLIIIRLVEFRGKGEKFAKKTTYFRRYGFVAFTIYTYQFFDVIPALLFSLTLGLPFSLNQMGAQVIFLLPLVFLWWELILRLWEKVDYTGGLEWSIGIIGERLLPGKRPPTKHWWQVSRLNAKEYLYEPEWLNIVQASEIPHDQLKESKLAYKLSIASFLCFPVFIIALVIAKNSIEKENVNKYNKRAKLLSIIGLTFYAIIIIALSLITGVTF